MKKITICGFGNVGKSLVHQIKIIKYASLDEKSNFDDLIKLIFGKDVQK